MRSLLWIVILIIAYGSLYPFHFIWTDPAQIAWLDWGSQFKQRTTNGDVLSNFLTFIPLGYFAFAAKATLPAPSFNKVLSIFLWGTLFALLLQVIQFYTPTRIPSVADALVNMLGIIVGIGIAVTVQLWLKHNPQLALDWPKIMSVPLVMACGWIVYQLFPFVPRFDFETINKGFEPLIKGPYFLWHEWFYRSVMWYCFIVFLQQIRGFKVNLSRLLLIVMAIMSSKLAIAHNSIHSADLLAALTALLVYRRLPAVSWNRWHFALICCAIFVREMYPFNYAVKPNGFNLVPFSYYLIGSMWTNTQNILEKLFAYGSLIFSAMEIFANRLLAISLCLFFIFTIELLQLALSYHYADITDLLIVVAVGYSFHQLRQTRMV